MMDILGLASIFYKFASSLPNPVIAYHVGAMNLEGDMFSIKHIKSGEGLAYLGPGTYFVTNKNIAKKYAQYRPNDATLYECKIDTSRIYDPFKGIPENYRGKLDEIGQEVLKLTNLSKLPYVSSLDYGTFEIGAAHKLLGASKAVGLFKQYNLSGFYEEIQPSVYEICVFDYSCVNILNKEILVDKEKIDFAKEKAKVQNVMKHFIEGDIFSCQFKDSSLNFSAKVSKVYPDNYITFDLLSGNNPDILENYYSFANENYGIFVDEHDFINQVYDTGGKIIFGK